MAKSIVTLVVEKLRANGFRAAEACPGKKMPALTKIAVAVDILKVDLGEKTASLCVSVLAPSSMGAQACQKAALSVAQVLQADGADCTQESCTFDGMTNLFCTRITAIYAGTASANDWADRAGFAVELSGVPVRSLVSFTAKQEIYGHSGWSFELEEFFRPEDTEDPETTASFTITVMRPHFQETFGECNWNYQERITTPTGTRQIRRGTANSRAIRMIV